MTCTKSLSLRTLTIALGANLPSEIGPPISTLNEVRPQIEEVLHQWIRSWQSKEKDIEGVQTELRFRWSPIFETDPIGGPSKQPNFINAVLIVDGESLFSINPSEKAAVELLQKLLKLEESFGRERSNSSIKWGPRTLDIDLLAWGDLQVKTSNLILPHPRLTERIFVLIPLAAALNTEQKSPRQIPPQNNWKE